MHLYNLQICKTYIVNTSELITRWREQNAIYVKCVAEVQHI